MTLTLDQANALLAAASTAATEHGAAMSIAVVDLTGRLVAFARMPGAGALSADVSVAKASTAVLLEGDTKDFGAATALTDAVAYPLALVPGGILIRDKSQQPLGGIGVAGAAPEIDHAVARAAVDSTNPTSVP